MTYINMIDQWSEIKFFRVLESANTIFTKDSGFNVIVFEEMRSEFSNPVSDLWGKLIIHKIQRGKILLQ